MKIVLDFGSSNTCRNNPKIIKRMIDELARVDKQRKCIIKFQIWSVYNPQGENLRLEEDMFDYAYSYGNSLGFEVTASVFDKESLDFLLEHEIPFVKIANRKELYWLIDYIPRTMPVYISYDNEVYLPKCLGEQDKGLYCVSKYPADIRDYWGKDNLKHISDHTIGVRVLCRHGWELETWEKHFKLPDSSGLDAGDFAITPKELGEILG